MVGIRLIGGKLNQKLSARVESHKENTVNNIHEVVYRRALQNVFFDGFMKLNGCSIRAEKRRVHKQAKNAPKILDVLQSQRRMGNRSGEIVGQNVDADLMHFVKVGFHLFIGQLGKSDQTGRIGHGNWLN